MNKKYRLTEDWLGKYKKGDEFPVTSTGELLSPNSSHQIANSIETSLLLKTGILEEVKEEVPLKSGEIYWYVSPTCRVDKFVWRGDSMDNDLKYCGNVFHSETDAKEASEKIKTLLLSLKK